MRFRLYAKNGSDEQMFYDSELGDQNRAISNPKIKLELSKAGSMEFVIFPTHPMYESFNRMTTYVRAMLDEDEIFRGRVLEVEDTTYMERTVRCEGDLAYLIDSFQPPDRTEGAGSGYSTNLSSSNAVAKAAVGSKAGSVGWHDINWTFNRSNISQDVATTSKLADQFIQYITEHNNQMEDEPQKQFEIGNITVSSTTAEVDFTSTNYRDTKSAVDGDLLKYYGGFLQTRRSNGTVYIDWLKEPGSNASQPIKMGVNLVDLQKTQNADSFYTVLVPVGEKQLTIEGVEFGTHQNRELVYDVGIGITSAIQQYGYIFKTESFSGVKTQSELLNQALLYLDSNYKPSKLSFSIRAIDMNLLDDSIESIKIGSYVQVESYPHGISQRLCCTSIEYDIQNPDNNSYEIGDPYETLSQKTKSDKTESAKATSSASHAGASARAANKDLEDIINQHAQQIKNTADELFEITTRILRVQAYAVEVKVDETVTLTCKDLKVDAGGSIDMNAGTSIKMGAGETYVGVEIYADGSMEIGPLSYHRSGQEGDFGGLGVYAEMWVQDKISSSGGIEIDGDEFLTFNNGGGGSGTTKLGVNKVESENGDFTSLLVGPSSANRTNLTNAVVSFSAGSASSAGVVTIPYTTASGGTGNITFDMAGTAWYIARKVTNVTATRESPITDSGDSVSATWRLHAKNADGDDIFSSTQTISMDYTPSGADISSSDIQIGNYRQDNIPHGTVASSLANTFKTANKDYVIFDVSVRGTDAVKTYSLPT